jgi:hypothetical protein
MSSADEFATCVKRLENLPPPFRKSVSDCIGENEAVLEVMFSPAFRAGKSSTFASVLCVTDNRWLVALSQQNGSITVDSASFETTLLLELTLILLYGQLKIDFLCDGQVGSTVLQFNTVMKDNYWDLLQNILDKIDHNMRGEAKSNWRGSQMLREWPLKFRNVANIYAPRGSRLIDGVQWGGIYGGFHRQLAPAAALLLTDRHIMIIAEEKPSSWFQFREPSHYGEVITYFPLERLAEFRVSEHPRFDSLEIVGHEGHGSKTIEVMLPHDQAKAVNGLMKKAAAISPSLAGVNTEGFLPTPITSGV